MSKNRNNTGTSNKLFADDQKDLFEKSYEEKIQAERSKPVECLGMTFPNDEKRREYFLDKLREKLKDPEFRKIEGFPIGEDEDILSLSDPPYYTACPNPFIEDFIKLCGKPYDPETDNYRREPFAADVSEGKNDPIYNAHSYHTKVPHKAIMRYILHYTEPGDIVFDGFCGTGMTGVAAQLCKDRTAIEALGYIVDKDGEVMNSDGSYFSKIGKRYSLMSDLSPTASFISGRYNSPVDFSTFDEDKRRVAQLKKELAWAYECKRDGKSYEINYVVWSDYVLCDNCGAGVCTFDAAIDQVRKKINSSYKCPQCGSTISKSSAKKVLVSSFDEFLAKPHSLEKRRPKLLSIFVGKQRRQIVWDEDDDIVIMKAESIPGGNRLPVVEIPYMHMTHERNTLPAQGITYIHHFYSKRNFLILSRIWEILKSLHAQLVFTSFCDRHAVLRNRWLLTGPTRPLNNTLYVPPLMTEVNVFRIFHEKYKDIEKALSIINSKGDSVVTTTQSSNSFPQIPDNYFDYIFVDPPFGGNILYSDLNIVWESWLGVRESRINEAVIDTVQKKGLLEYHELIRRCFQEFYRILKPGRWITVEFHSSKSSVWNAIQDALQAAGFVVSDVQTLDKVQGTIHQDSKSSSVKQDLIISAYKPNGGLEERFKLEAGTEEGVWDFIRTHLMQLPILVLKDDQVEVIAERQNYLLFDRMVAFHVQRGVTVPLSASEFYAGLEQRFPSRDGMYFSPDQVAEYDKKRMTVKEVIQLQLYVTDEYSAIQWLNQLLTKKPQSFQDIHPQFLKEIGGWQNHEKPLELSYLLEQNFLRYDGKGEVQSQIHSYLSTNFKELRNLPKDDPALKSKGKDRWYVPDPNKAGDLEKLRERALLREFNEYRESKQKRLKVFRLEAVRAGFKKAWQERDYATIIAVALKIPDTVLQEDPKLLMWYDQAITRAGEEA